MPFSVKKELLYRMEYKYVTGNNGFPIRSSVHRNAQNILSDTDLFYTAWTYRVFWQDVKVRTA